MATAYTLIPLSGSTHGRPIKVVQTATAGTLIHTANAVTADDTGDLIELYATNTSAANVVLTLEVGGVTSPDDLVKHTIPAGGTIPLGEYLLRNALVLRAFAGSANVINVFGKVYRLTTV
jgi:hypothetical protein